MSKTIHSIKKIIKFVGLLSNNKEKMIDFYECMKDTYYYIGRVAPFVIRYLFMVIMLLLPLSLYSIQQSPVFRSVTVSEGLSHNTINAIYKDTRGFVWLGTQMGLDRFDGVNVTTYPQFSGRTVFSIAETDSVNLWVGTDIGLIKFNRKTETVEPIVLDGKSLSVKVVFVSKKGRLLLGSSRGLFLYESGVFRKILLDSNALSAVNGLMDIVDGEDDSVWIASNGGLIHYNMETGRSRVFENNIRGGLNYYSCLALMGNTIYLGTANQGMLKFDIGQEVFSIYPQIGNGCIKDLVPVGNDTLYVGINGSGVKIIKASSGQEITSIEHSIQEDAICSNAVYSLLKDKNILYIGTYMGGMSYTPTRGNTFSIYSFKDKFDSHNLNVRAFWIGKQGRKVIGTRDGLYYISEEENIVKHYTIKSSILRSDIILSVKPLGEDYLIGTYGGGMYLLHAETGKLSFFKPDDCFRQNSFTGCERDKEGKYWIGSSYGVYVYNELTGQYVNYNNRNSSLAINSIFTLKADSKDRIWIGTNGAVFLYDMSTGTFKSDVFPEHIEPFTKSIRYIYEDNHKNLWFCDDKEGVVKVDEHFTKFEHLTVDDFLPNNSVMSIIEDPHDGGLWFSTQRGLLYIKDNHHKIFSLYDGIPGYIFNNPVQITDDGSIWWGNERGLVKYTSQLKHERKVIPLPPAITSVAVAGRILQTGDELLPFPSSFMEKISLPADKNNIAFTFSALNYAVVNTDIYEYFLEGYDKEWLTLMKGNQVAYMNLPVGNYVFKVRAASNPGAVMAVKVEVVRGLSFTLWMVVLCFLTCLVLLYSYYALLGKYRKMKEDMRENTVQVEGVQKEKYQKSRVDEEEVSRIKQRLTECMNKDKMYLNPDLKLQDVANTIGCNAGDLSQVLNLYLNINFTDYINQYRVEEFIIRVQDKSASKYTLAFLSEQCGFSSRTSFFRSFKKLKGKSPAEYIKEKDIILEI